jgi:molybdenum cofactor cytidylyltransferase
MLLPAVLLAAGQSSRLGSPKQMVRMNDETLLERTARIAAEAGADPVIAVLGANADRLDNLRFPANTIKVLNEYWEEGVASSICAGMKVILEQYAEAEAVLLLVCDQPAVTEEHLRSLILAAQREDGTLATAASSYASVTGTPAIFPARRFSQLLALRGDKGARSLLRDPEHPPVLTVLPHGEIDIDTKEDLANWQRL